MQDVGIDLEYRFDLKYHFDTLDRYQEVSILGLDFAMICNPSLMTPYDGIDMGQHWLR